jgi:hypothetical protein
MRSYGTGRARESACGSRLPYADLKIATELVEAKQHACAEPSKQRRGKQENNLEGVLWCGQLAQRARPGHRQSSCPAAYLSPTRLRALYFAARMTVATSVLSPISAKKTARRVHDACLFRTSLPGQGPITVRPPLLQSLHRRIANPATGAAHAGEEREETNACDELRHALMQLLTPYHGFPVLVSACLSAYPGDTPPASDVTGVVPLAPCHWLSSPSHVAL